jgi:hypothetical protein
MRLGSFIFKMQVIIQATNTPEALERQKDD